MTILIWLFTFLLVLDCLILILLVLIQLPKKEAGMGQAFGGGATDALFGAGSGTALTKLTKYTAGIFFVLTLTISLLHGHQARSRGDLRTILSSDDKMALVPAVPKTNAAVTTTSNALSLTTGTNVAKPDTNAPVEKK